MKVTEVRVFCPCCHQHTPTKLHSWTCHGDGSMQVYAEILDPTKVEGERTVIEIDIAADPQPPS